RGEQRLLGSRSTQGRSGPFKPAAHPVVVVRAVQAPHQERQPMQAVSDDPRRPSLPTGISPYARRGYHQQLSELLGAEDPKELLGLLLRCPALPQRLEVSMELPGELRLVADGLVQPPTDAVDV